MLNFKCAAALAAWLISALVVSPLQAQTVWRCGEGGKVYSDSPCPGGKPVAVADPRSASEVRSAQDSVQRTQALADRMRLQRLQDEQRNLAANALAANVGPSKAITPKADRKGLLAKAEPDDAVKPRKPAKQGPRPHRRQPHHQPDHPPQHQPQPPSKGAAADAGTSQAIAAWSRRIRD